MDSIKLRKALSKFATGITVVTTSDKNKNPFGVTVNSFTSVSLEPPLVLWCLGDQTVALETFLEAENFVVNILSSNQQDISDNFAIPGDFDYFANIAYTNGNNNMPVLENCLANLECERSKIESVGDHWVFISRIETFHLIEGDPLLYYMSSYRQLDDS